MRPLFFLALVAMCASCKKSPMDRVEEIRDQLASDSPRYDGALPICTPSSTTCGSDVAAAIGAPYDEKKPDQVSAAAVAVLVARDHRGSAVGSPDVWIGAMRKAKGPGADALRLATALEMSRVAPVHAHALDTDGAARAFLRDVAAAIPGACKTYEALGDGADPDRMAPEDSPDHSACVQRDLARKEGPGGGYGAGLFRGAAGALALLEHTLAALHDGSAQMSGKYKQALEARLTVIDAAAPKIAPKHVEAPAGNAWSQMADEHRAPLAADAGPAR